MGQGNHTMHPLAHCGSAHTVKELIADQRGFSEGEQCRPLSLSLSL